jgi:5-formyltetrahydrofolate cyclo-ligase
VLVPVVRGPGEMLWSRLETWDDLARGHFGLLEPRGDRTRPSTPPPGAICLVPGIAFTPDGGRIGYGGGYFDRFLIYFDGFTAGMAFNVQMRDALPLDECDVRVHAVVTESAVYRRAN